MTNQNDSDNPSSDTKNQSPLDTPVTPVAPQEGQTSEKGNGRSENEKDVSTELAREFKWVELAQIVSNIILAIVGIFALCIYSGQLKEMRKSSKAAEDAAQAAQSAADTANDTLRETQQEQRPWVTIASAKVLEIKSGQPIKGQVVLMNSGKTLALNVTMMGRMRIRNYDADLPVLDVEKFKDATENILAPGQQMAMSLDTDEIITSAQETLAKLPNVKFYFYGRSRYIDTTINPIVHHTEFCYFITLATPDLLLPCEKKRYKNNAD
jgi:hypothetical protein